MVVLHNTQLAWYTKLKWPIESRFIHSEKRIKKHFMRYVCEWDYMEPPHGKEAMNTEQKRAIAMGGYDKNPPLVGLAQVW